MKSRNVVASLALLVGFMAAQAAEAQVAPTGSWSTRTASPVGLGSYGSGCSDGTYMWYCGGTSSPNANVRYDPTANSWNNSLAAYTGYPYYHSMGNIGGSTGSNYVGAAYVDGQIHRYNIASNTWTNSFTTLTGPGYYSAAASGAGKVWYSGGGGTAAMVEFNGTTVTARTNMPAAMYAHSLTFIPSTGLVYAIGGTSGSGTNCFEFNPTANTWTTKTARPIATQFGASSFSLKSRVYSLTGSPASCYEFAPTANIWTQRASAPYTHYYMSGAGAYSVTKGYVWGGQGSTNCSEFIPPSFGSDPIDPPLATVKQIGSLGDTPQAGVDPDLGWTDTNIIFSAQVTDPDAGQQVMLEIECRPAGTPFTGVKTLDSGLVAQGTVTASYAIPAGGNYDWQYRVKDDYDNFTPNTGGIPGWYQFKKNAITADFRSDQVAPSTPQGIYPDMYDVSVPSLVSGDITFQWTASTDNGPAAAIRYSIQVALNDAGFGAITASQSGIVPTNTTINLAVSRYNYYYHVGATDIGGNFSGWGTTKYFRVTGDDGQNHSAGDAAKVCGGSAMGAGSSLMILAGMALTALAGLRKRK